MCLTMPKKVISIIDNDEVIVELPNGDRQEVKTIIELKPGDYVLTQQNVVVQDIDKEYARELINIINGGKANV